LIWHKEKPLGQAGTWLKQIVITLHHQASLHFFIVINYSFIKIVKALFAILYNVEGFLVS